MLFSSDFSRRTELTTKLGPRGSLSGFQNQQEMMVELLVLAITVSMTCSERSYLCTSYSTSEVHQGLGLSHQCPVLSLAEFGWVTSQYLIDRSSSIQHEDQVCIIKVFQVWLWQGFNGIRICSFRSFDSRENCNYALSFTNGATHTRDEHWVDESAPELKSRAICQPPRT